MRVAMVGPHPLPGQPPVGGVEVVTQTLVGALRAEGADVTVITCAKGRAATDRASGHGGALTVVPSDVRSGRVTWYARERAAIRRELLALAPDVVHAQGGNFYAPGALSAGLPTVVTLHGILHREGRITDASSGIVERASKRLRGAGNSAFERATLRKATDLVIISTYVEEVVRGRTQARLHAIPNPVVDRFYSVARRPQPGRLLFVGSIEPVKNVLALVRAFHRTRDRLPSATLRLVGPPRDMRYHRAVLAELAAAGDRRAAYVGPRYGNDLIDEYASAAALVLPSRHESSPLAVQQAMAAGLPVVASRAGGADRLVDEGTTGTLVPPDDTAAIADAIVAMLGAADLATMGRAAKEKAARFRECAVAAATLDAYRSVVDRARRTTSS
jgi:glycosyltransferase involved in cell wall biosynthesis